MNINNVTVNDSLLDRLIDEFRMKMLEDGRNIYFKRMELKNACKNFVEDFACRYNFTFTPIKHGEGVIFMNNWSLVAMIFTDPDCAVVEVYAVENGIEELEPAISTGKVYD